MKSVYPIGSKLIQPSTTVGKMVLVEQCRNFHFILYSGILSKGSQSAVLSEIPSVSSRDISSWCEDASWTKNVIQYMGISSNNALSRGKSSLYYFQFILLMLSVLQFYSVFLILMKYFIQRLFQMLNTICISSGSF